MIEDKIQNLLRDADRTMGPPVPVSVELSTIRRRAHRRRAATLAVPVATAAVVMVILGLWGITSRFPKTKPEQERIASLELQVKQLQARADATLKLIQEVLEDERRQRRLDQLQAELTSIGNPLEELQKQVESTAFILVYQADRMYRELNQTDLAIRTYRRVVELFPQTESAEVARQRLSEIQKNQPNRQI